MTSSNGLPGGPRSIRRLDASEAPWPGVLAEDDDGARCVLVDVVELVDDVAWRGSAGGHLAAARDLVRTPAGHVAVLPVCTARLASVLAHRRDASTPLSAGEAVTLAVSVLRGIEELDGAGCTDVAGQWWLDEDGRPLLVGGGEQPARDAAAALVDDVAAAHVGALAAALGYATEVLRDPRRLRREYGDVEAALFATAHPEPLATATLGPTRARVAAALPEGPADSTPAKAGWWEGLVPHIDATLPDMASEVLTRLWRRLRADRPRRRGHPIAVAAVLGALVVAGGLLWPRGTEEPALAQPRHPSPAATPAATVTPRATTSPHSTADRSLEQVAADLLARRAACADRACAGATQEDPDAEFTGDSGAPDEQALTLLDDYGGAAVLRADGDDGAARLVVIVRRDGEWLLRDIRDVAEQPAG